MKDTSVNLLNVVRKMSNLNRMNSMFILRPQSLADHSFHVATLSLMIAKSIQTQPIDIEKVLSVALLHDLEEVFTGDIPYPVKKQYTRLNQELEVTAAFELSKLIEPVDLYKSGRLVISAVKNTSDNSLESQIVVAADMLELLIRSIEEVLVGNRTTEVTEVINNAYGHLSQMVINKKAPIINVLADEWMSKLETLDLELVKI